MKCDKNVGKWRRHENCNQEDAGRQTTTAWEVYKMPIRASTANAMYEACKNDYFPNSTGMWGSEAGDGRMPGEIPVADANGDVEARAWLGDLG